MRVIKDGQIKTAIFDMDGTIYQLDGDNGGWKNSTLQKKVKSNSAKLVSEKENITLEEAEAIIEDLNQKGTFLSLCAVEKYGLTRKEFFDEVWNIDPSTIVNNYQEALTVLAELAKQKIELILLTQSPQVWQNNVFSYLNLHNIFAEIHTGENYLHKTDIFPLIAQARNPKTVLSVGDQLHSDITPASEQGFHVFHVTSPKDLLKLINND